MLAIVNAHLSFLDAAKLAQSASDFSETQKNHTEQIAKSMLNMASHAVSLSDAAEVLQKLEDAWLNEKHSPELLDPKMEIVECMLEQVTEGCHPAKP